MQPSCFIWLSRLSMSIVSGPVRPSVKTHTCMHCSYSHALLSYSVLVCTRVASLC
ncbi:unnamed protein product [Tetraodon nigroviridis]|uniref:(spotted green pufferfish) hypothetical protein n=1 Tax=Tetraodon nigroviridis TaxID=99883 RepID=Q4SQK1_TETNG|nr:unnamed protein product [Tetraodon nigroviridis]